MGISEVFQALSDPTRREIVRMLRASDMSAGEIAERFPLAKSTLSGHFSSLRHAGLIVSERRSTRIVYSLSLSAFEEVLNTILEIFGTGEPSGDGTRHKAGRR
jgi:ArsR family transcriptional regulator, arsenate/arsenite/antimonite-responsive transcriptional repressor